MGYRVEIEILFFSEGVEFSKKNRWQSLHLEKYKVEGRVLYKNYLSSIQTISTTHSSYSNVFEEKNYDWLKLSGIVYGKYKKL